MKTVAAQPLEVQEQVQVEDDLVLEDRSVEVTEEESKVTRRYLVCGITICERIVEEQHSVLRVKIDVGGTMMEADIPVCGLHYSFA